MYQLRTDDNVTLCIEDINPQCADTIMMVHGWPMEKTIFEYQTTYFARNGHRCLLPDLRGFGRSETAICDYTYDRMARDLYTIIRRLRPRNLILLGFDMGGAICARYMSRYRGYGVCGLALVAAALPCFTSRKGCAYGMEATTLNNMVTLTMTDRAQMVEEYTSMFYNRTPTEAAKHRVETICMNNSIVATIECAKTLMHENLAGELSNITAPTGIFHGSNDSITPMELAFIQKDSIPNSRLFEFADTGHLLIQEQVDPFNETLGRFIKDL